MCCNTTWILQSTPQLAHSILCKWCVLCVSVTAGMTRSALATSYAHFYGMVFCWLHRGTRIGAPHKYHSLMAPGLIWGGAIEVSRDLCSVAPELNFTHPWKFAKIKIERLCAFSGAVLQILEVPLHLRCEFWRNRRWCWWWLVVYHWPPPRSSSPSSTSPPLPKPN